MCIHVSTCVHVSACVYMCIHVSTCVHVSACVYMCLFMSLVSAIVFTFTPIHVLYLEFPTCMECRHTVWFLTTVCRQFAICYSPFADTVFCILCYVFID